jgi:hypothetical protein
MKRSVVWIYLITVVSLLPNKAIHPMPTDGPLFAVQQISSEPGIYLTPYRPHKLPLMELPEFHYFSLKEFSGQETGEFKTDSDGNVIIGGKLSTRDGIIYNFKTARLIKGKSGYERLKFTTQKIDGVYYIFEGQYLNEPKEADGQFITLQGVLVKYKNGQKIASINLDLYQWIEA